MKNNNNENDCVVALDNIRKDFTCPVSLELLYEAVTLVSCAHKLNQKVAETIFIKDEENNRTKNCPVCNQKVEGWVFDHTFRNIVLLIFGEPRRDPASILRRLHMEELQEENQEIPEPPYPGKAAKFVNNHGVGVWEKGMAEIYDNYHYKQMIFKSDTKNSLLIRFILSEKKKYSNTDFLEFSIQIDFKEDNAEKIIEYFEHYGIPSDGRTSRFDSGSYFTENKREIKVILKRILEHNFFSDIDFEKLKIVVENI